MKLPDNPRIHPTGTLKVDTALVSIHQEVSRAIRNISFGTNDGGPDNIQGSWANVVTPAGANTEFAVVHNLGRVPQGWIMIGQDKAASVYQGATPWTSTQIFLKCNTSSVTIRIFVV